MTQYVTLAQAQAKPRPTLCGDFPVGGPHAYDIAHRVERDGEAPVLTNNLLTRCSWWDVVVVPEGDPRLAQA